jgi:hypothetical protein
LAAGEEMSVQVKTIDVFEAKKALKKCPKIVQDYVKSLESVYEMCKETNKIALKKIKELSK